MNVVLFETWRRGFGYGVISGAEVISGVDLEVEERSF